MKIEWIDGGHGPRCPSDPAYPDGIDIAPPWGDVPTCKVDLPYPAARVGCYVIKCEVCGIQIGATTAGRPDDPRSIVIPCKITSAKQ